MKIHPLPLHYTGKSKVLPGDNRAEYLIGDRRFTIEGPGMYAFQQISHIYRFSD